MTAAIAALFLSMSFALCVSVETEALEFVDNTSLDTPWTSSFTPLDSAWDSTGTQCVVVGNDTSGIQASAWHYNEPSNTWTPILEGSDVSIPAVHLVENNDTGNTYASIQAAVDAATSGDLLHVWSGTYSENIVIGKQLTILGNGSASTVIDGGNIGPAVIITADFVTLGGFTVTGGSDYTGIMLYEVNYCRIENNTVKGNGDGICLSGSSDNIIKNNYIENNAGVGVKAQSSPAMKDIVGTTESGGALDSGAMFKMNLEGDNYTILNDFIPGFMDGLFPTYGFKFISDSVDPNILYGLTRVGGSYNHGVLFRINRDGSNYMLLHDFLGGTTDGDRPSGSLAQSGTLLYGMTNQGGAFGSGTIYRISTSGMGFTILHSFDYALDGAYPTYNSLTLSGTMLYGMLPQGGTNGVGTLFTMNTDGSGFTVRHHFTSATTGSYPNGGLIFSSPMLYGMASQGGPGTYGTIFKYSMSTLTMTVIHNFTSALAPFPDGRNPYGNVMLDGIYLYGLTYGGGNMNAGSLFRMDTTGANFIVLHNFTTAGDGYQPQGSLVQDGVTLYGTTYSGGSNGYGSIFSYAKMSKAYKVIYNFTSVMNSPYGSLFLSGTTLYGAATYSDVGGGGLFSVQTSGAAFFPIHEFLSTTTSSLYPEGSVLQVGTQLFGMTNSGGMYDFGGVYRIGIDGNGFSMLHHFQGSPDGESVYGGFINDGTTLYGVTSYGGSIDSGTVFSLSTDGSNYKLIHNFTSTPEGRNPYSTISKIGSVLYGTTRRGGATASTYGTIYSMNIDGTNYQELHGFMGAPNDGTYPYGSLTLVGTKFYGMTAQGGTLNAGTIYSINTDGTGFKLIHNFTNSDGYYPIGALTNDGTTLYGVTNGGGNYNQGVIFKIETDGTGYAMMRSLDDIDGTYPVSKLLMNGQYLYGMTTDSGPLGFGTVFRINKYTYDYNILHNFAGSPGDAAYPYYNELSFIEYPSAISSNNIIYHNNFIGNAIQALNDDLPVNMWSLTISEGGGNYWSDYVGADGNSDGIGDVERTIPDTPLTMDSYPWLLVDGWDIPYSTFRSVIWDDVYDRFWLCGDVSSTAESELYYITAANPSVMVPIPTGIPQSFTAVASDTLGNLLIGGNNLQYLYYYVHSAQMGYPVSESSTGTMFGWNVTSITYNPNDSRFYIVGCVLNEDKAVAFATAAGPLTGSPSYCYIDTSSLLNSPGIGTLRSISWNPSRNYALAVGDGVYRLDEWWGTGNPLSWSVIQEPQVGIIYNDLSWDSDGYVEAGIVGRNGTFGNYWRYYHTNPTLLDGYTSAIPLSNYKTCAMKPPSSPKWLIIPSNVEIPRINLEEKDESGIITFASEFPQIFSVEISKQSDVTHPDLMDTQVDADSTYTFFIESNYTVGGFDHWNDLAISLCAWYDGNTVGMASSPGSWASDVYRTKQFNVTYNPATDFATLMYPTPVAPAGEEFSIDSWWQDPIGHGADGFTHHLYINVTFGPQTWAATGPSTPSGGTWGKNLALNDLNTWDLQVHMYDSFSTGNYNLTYMEFGIKEFAEIASSGSPSGTAPPGTNGYHLSTPCTIYYATNTEHYVTVSISNMYFGGDPLETKLIPATKLQTENLHPLATPLTSDISSQIYFAAAGTPLYVWGLSSLVPEAPPEHGTQMAGPDNTDYIGALTPPFVQTTIDWWIDVPVSITSGIYIGTITITIMD